MRCDIDADHGIHSSLQDALPANSVDFVYDNYAAKGSADKAMRVIRPGGAYLLLPNIIGAKLSAHPKPGVRQIDFGFTSSSNHTGLDVLKALFDGGQL